MANYIWGDQETQFFFHLTPDIILDAVESLGHKTTGRCLTLNSMENRVYEIELDLDSYDNDSERFVIGKFYRPGRWSEQQILDEHKFLKDLEDAEIPVIAPLSYNDKTLFKLPEHDIFFCLFPKRGGRVPDEMSTTQLEIMGRLLARIHSVGECSDAKHRIHINPTNFGRDNLSFLLDNKFIPFHLEESYKNIINKICELSDPLFEGIKTHRIHGDCHHGNVIYREDTGFNFIDFDDMLVGPAVQDIWLIVPGRDHYAIQDRNTMIDSYCTMRDFDFRELKLIEPLRALRYIHFAAWIAKRWDDPSFKASFGHFGTDQYWDTLLADLRQQLTLIQEASQPTYDYY